MQLGEFEIEYGEAWLLETAVRSYIPLTFLAMGHKAIEAQFAHPSHAMNRGDLLKTHCSLFERGDLVADQEVLGVHRPTPEELDRALTPPVRQPNGGVRWGSGRDAPLFYMLSQAGAERWERMAQPDWTRYFEDTWPEENHCKVTAGSEQRRDEILKNSRQLWAVEPVAGTIETDVVTPWEATYWKTLPAGYRARFKHQWPDCPGGRLVDDWQELKRRDAQLRRWCRSVFERAG